MWGSQQETYLNANQGFKPGKPDDPDAVKHWWSYHSGGAHFLFVDGSTRFLAYNLDAATFLGLGTKDGEELTTGY